MQGVQDGAQQSDEPYTGREPRLVTVTRCSRERGEREREREGETDGEGVRGVSHQRAGDVSTKLQTRARAITRARRLDHSLVAYMCGQQRIGHHECLFRYSNTRSTQQITTDRLRPSIHTVAHTSLLGEHGEGPDHLYYSRTHLVWRARPISIQSHTPCLASTVSADWSLPNTAASRVIHDR